MPTSTLASGVLAGDATAARVGRSGSGALCAEHAISTDRNAIETKGTSLLPIPHLLSFATAVYAAVRRLAREVRCLRPMAAISSAPTCARSRSPYRQRAQRAFRRSLTPGSFCANTGSGSEHVIKERDGVPDHEIVMTVDKIGPAEVPGSINLHLTLGRAGPVVHPPPGAVVPA